MLNSFLLLLVAMNDLLASVEHRVREKIQEVDQICSLLNMSRPTYIGLVERGKSSITVKKILRHWILASLSLTLDVKVSPYERV